jgi:hypothetical protein
MLRIRAKTLTVLVIVGAATSGIGACDGVNDGDGGGPVTGAFLTAADLQPGALIALDEDDVSDNMDDEDEFMAVPPLPEDGADDATCLVRRFAGALKLAAAGDTASVGGRFTIDRDDFTACGLGAGFPAGVRFSATGRLYTQLSCTGANLTALDGKALGEVFAQVATLVDACSGPATELRNIEQTVKVSGTVLGMAVDSQQHLIELAGSASATPCDFRVDAGQVHVGDNCVVVNRGVNEKAKLNGQPTDDQGKEDHTRLEARGLVRPVDGRPLWYSGGSMAVTMNDWSGEVRYTAANAAPTWTMRRGPESIDGTLPDPTDDDVANALRETPPRVAVGPGAHLDALVRGIRAAVLRATSR